MGMVNLPRRPRRLRSLLAVMALVPALVLAACGDDDADDDVTSGAEESPSATDTTGAGAADDGYGGAGTGGSTSAAAAVRAVDFRFELADDAVAPGARLTFANEDGAPHTMTADDGAFDSGRVEGGDTATVTAPSEPGDHAFHCEIHPEMQATLTVEG